MYDCVLAQELQQVELLEMKQQEKKDIEQLQVGLFVCVCVFVCRIFC